MLHRAQTLPPKEQRGARYASEALRRRFEASLVANFGKPGADAGEGPFPGDRDAELEELERDVEARMARVAECQAELPGLLAEKMARYLTGMRPAEDAREREGEGAGAPGGAEADGENADPNAGGAAGGEEAKVRIQKIQEAGQKADLGGLYQKLGGAVSRLENIYEVKSTT